MMPSRQTTARSERDNQWYLRNTNAASLDEYRHAFI